MPCIWYIRYSHNCGFGILKILVWREMTVVSVLVSKANFHTKKHRIIWTGNGVAVEYTIYYNV